MIKLADYLKPSKPLSRLHRGTVIDNVDPLKLQRVKCSISYLFDAKDKDKIPWIYPTQSSNNSVDVPKIGDQLIVTFPFNDIYSGVYNGHFQSVDKVNEYLTKDDYPNIFGFVKEKIKAFFNDLKGNGSIEHTSGTKLDIAEDGSVTFNLSKDITITVEGKISKNSKGDITFSSDANVTISGKSAVNVSSDANVTISGKSAVNVSSDGNVVVAGKGGTDAGSNSSPTNVNGTMVNLAGGGLGVALMGAQCIGVGNLGAPVTSMIVEGSSKVFAPK